MNRHRLLAASHLLLIKQFKQDFIDIYLYVGPSSETDAFNRIVFWKEGEKHSLYRYTM